jgi:hypothetical protein
MAEPTVPEEVYREAAMAYARAIEANPPLPERVITSTASWLAVEDGSIRAAVESAYRAGFGAGRDYEAKGGWR